ncbi:AMP-binding protein [Agromyces larvae]|uniref:AMP-binding protein n=1 Tax=Agromyces larvae TaxID=2929802 RepID=A0ABY4BY23_9MICO|nr:AMP-binding protein [Agromyces larvae]UOE43794.1 AMP-binding protein [Agromyces larvae]
MKPLLPVSASDVPALTRALAAALDGGAAVFPVAAGDLVAPAAEVDDDLALVVETSGSTDAPKRVLLTADALTASADATHDVLGGIGRWLLALPGHYIAGAQVIVRSLLAGSEPVSLGAGGFDPRAFAEASVSFDPTIPRYTSLVPVQLARVVDAAERDRFIAAALGSFDAVLLGGQAAPAELIARAETLGARVVRTYGSSETAGGCVYDGVPLPGARIRIVDEEVQLTGPMLAAGYLRDPERTARAFETDATGTRWYRTGDLGAFDADGRLRIRGRADDVIISGGVKVALGEVERAVRALPGLGDAVVVPVADPEWGERAAVVSGGASVSLDALAEATDAAGLHPAARPVRFEVLDPLPMLASGKPDRRAIRASIAPLR